jgi:hypothetical protein
MIHHLIKRLYKHHRSAEVFRYLCSIHSQFSAGHTEGLIVVEALRITEAIIILIVVTLYYPPPE